MGTNTTGLNRGNPNLNIEKRKATRAGTLKARNLLIAKKHIEGKSHPTIAKEISKITGKEIKPQTVMRILQKDEIKAVLEKAYCKLAGAVPKVTDNIIEAAESFTPGVDENNKIAWEANKLIAQAHGLVPTAQQSIVHQTYIQNQTNNLIPPVIAELAKKHFGGMINLNNIIEMKEDAEKESFVNGENND